MFFFFNASNQAGSPSTSVDWSEYDGEDDGEFTSIMDASTFENRGHTAVGVNEDKAFIVFTDDASGGTLHYFNVSRSGTSLTPSSLVNSSNATSAQFPTAAYLGNDRVIVCATQTTQTVAKLLDVSGTAPSSLDRDWETKN